MTTNASRVPVDYDGYEQDRQPAPTRQGHPGARPDPLAELARIVGQDDPFRALLEAKEAKEATRAAEPPRGRVEPVMPSYGEAPLPESGLSATRSEPTLGAPMPAHTPASAFNQYLAAVERETDSEPAPAAPEPETNPEPRPRGRRRIALVGTALGIVAASIGGALTWKAFHHSRSGAPILVVADQTPLKVAPQNAGGVEIPDQNKQIYERTATAPAKDGQIRIVNREEQPLDVKQAARSLAAEAGASATPAAPGNALTESLGEPRRVRTVSVRPEPSPAEAQRAAQAAAQAQAAQGPAASPIPTMTLPSEATGSTPAPITPRGPRTIATAPVSRTPVAEAPAETPVAEPRQKPVQRVASAEAPTTTQAVPTPQAPVGGFSVQLSVRATEKEAEVAFRQAQERYGAVLGGQSPLIRQAEVNGKSIYRVRVGPMAKDSADSLCGKLKAAGAACFVAKN
ncbi:Sporulation related domain-containing protein [Methylobacterium sp. 174MFSha1.1]|uniref:SPOR domain-containing protein n=1 Tax=Methylobacterium sp. 174MFSha1.1 TaxID=1502749 RepID=UPI0008F3BA6E|nr:SPOR domain-containing protein [Methylobacterium sp. 174MFSha1.1]SFU82176.1 Sporulation related domain-containing protein [Methylobacterium sp. 174MFSha1.1]